MHKSCDYDYHNYMFLDTCIFEDDSFDRVYTLFSNGNWTISETCGLMNVTTSNIICSNSNGIWNPEVQCPSKQLMCE